MPDENPHPAAGRRRRVAVSVPGGADLHDGIADRAAGGAGPAGPAPGRRSRPGRGGQGRRRPGRNQGAARAGPVAGPATEGVAHQDRGRFDRGPPEAGGRRGPHPGAARRNRQAGSGLARTGPDRGRRRATAQPDRVRAGPAEGRNRGGREATGRRMGSGPEAAKLVCRRSLSGPQPDPPPADLHRVPRRRRRLAAGGHRFHRSGLRRPDGAGQSAGGGASGKPRVPGCPRPAGTGRPGRALPAASGAARRDRRLLRGACGHGVMGIGVRLRADRSGVEPQVPAGRRRNGPGRYPRRGSRPAAPGASGPDCPPARRAPRPAGLPCRASGHGARRRAGVCRRDALAGPARTAGIWRPGASKRRCRLRTAATLPGLWQPVRQRRRPPRRWPGRRPPSLSGRGPGPR